MNQALDGVVSWAEVDLDAIAENVRSFRQHAGLNVEVFAVVKANAYGHGAVPVARAALEAGASRLAVHRAIEGVQLRRAGIQAPILVMGYTPEDGADLVVRWGLTPSVIDLAAAQAFSARAEAGGVTVPVHIKLDTGMSRYGVMPADALAFAQAVRALPGLALEGLFTHFATADAADTQNTLSQLNVFSRVLAVLQDHGIDIPLAHTANSAAAMRLPEAHFNAIRPGIAMYGMDPSSEWAPVFPLHPALSLKSRISRIHPLTPGSAVGYGRTFVAEHELLAALVPVGYGDGYHRSLSNRGKVLVGGQFAPVLGRVSMDQIVVDASAVPDAKPGDEVVLVGRQGENCIRAEEVARWAGTINYEITTSLLPRVARLYTHGGYVVGVDRLDED